MISKYGWINMNLWVIIAIVVAALMCCICSLSCFYNYKVLRTRVAPFWVPSFCPDCLFPRKLINPIMDAGGAYNMYEDE